MAPGSNLNHYFKMKSIKYISALALALAMVSCDGYDLPNPPGQENQEPEFFFQDGDLAIEKEGTSYNLQQLNEQAKDLVVAKVTKLENFPSQYELAADVVVGNDASFSKSYTITATVNGDLITVLPTLMNTAIQQTITKAPGTYSPYVKIIAYAERGNTRIALGGMDNSYVNLPYQITTFDPTKVIEQNYYFYNATTGTCTKMENILGPNVNAYDSPEFKYVFDSPADAPTNNIEWYILPESAYNNGQPLLDQKFGCIYSEDNGVSNPRQGKLVAGGEVGLVNIAGPTIVTINLETEAYRVAVAFDRLYVLSGKSEAKPELAMTLPTTDFINYKGVTTIKGGYYINGTPSRKSETIYGQRKNTEVLESWDADQTTVTLTGQLTDVASLREQLQAPFKEEGLYYLEVNNLWMTYNLTALQTFQVEVNGTLFELTSADKKVWKSEGKINLSKGFKFWCNGQQAAYFGAVNGQFLTGETGTLECTVDYQGGDITLSDKGNIGEYNVTLDFSTYPYTVTLTK